MSVSHHYLQLEGVRLHYASSGDGPVLLFLHGFPECWYEWKQQMAAFQSEYRVVAPDLRGYNLSDKPTEIESYSAKHLVGDVKGLIDHLSPNKPVILVAHDWGGFIAWRVAMSYPDLIEKLVIINAPHPITFLRELATNPEQRKASAYMNYFRQPETEDQLLEDNCRRLQKILFDSSGDPSIFSEEDRAAYLEAWSQPGAIAGGLNYYRAMQGDVPSENSDTQSMLLMVDALLAKEPHTVTVPTLVLWGMKDTALLPGLLNNLDAFVPDLHIEKHSNGSHWIIHEYPDWINSQIRSFIKN